MAIMPAKAGGPRHPQPRRRTTARHVRVNAIAPAMVRTPENVDAAGAAATYVEMSQITDGIMFLASPAAEAINGLVLPISRGAVLAMELAGRVALVTGAGRRLAGHSLPRLLPAE